MSEGSNPIPADVLPPDFELGGYRVLSLIGEGGSGLVYRALHIESDRTVALKVLRPELSESVALVDAFVDEAKTVARLGHENIIDVFYAGRGFDGTTYLAMELLDGTDLHDLLMKRGPLPWAVVRPFMLQTARALAAAHAAGIVHGDLKPANIFLAETPEGDQTVKLLDFGAARLLSGQDPRSAVVTMATPEYVAPEQAIGAPIDARTDVYTLGAVMYHMLTGQLPFPGKDPIEMMAAHQCEPLIPPRQRRPNLPIPAGVEAVILRAMEKAPSDRYQSMEEMAEAIERCRFLAPAGAPAAGSPSAHATPAPLAQALASHEGRTWRLARRYVVPALAGIILAAATVFVLSRM